MYNGSESLAELAASLPRLRARAAGVEDRESILAEK